MKTKNNIQKTAFAAVAAFGLIIFGFAVSAQFTTTSLFDYTEAHQMAMAIDNTAYSFNATTGNTNDFDYANTFAAYLAEEIDEPLHLEEWMTEESNFTTVYNYEAETEKPLQVEDWMIDETTFDANSMILEVETETPMNIEEWMVDEEKFSNNKTERSEVKAQNNSSSISTETFFYREVNNEEKLRIEAWMVNPKIWKQ